MLAIISLVPPAFLFAIDPLWLHKLQCFLFHGTPEAHLFFSCILPDLYRQFLLQFLSIALFLLFTLPFSPPFAVAEAHIGYFYIIIMSLPLTLDLHFPFDLYLLEKGDAKYLSRILAA